MVDFKEIKAMSLKDYDDKFIGRGEVSKYIEKEGEMNFTINWVNSLPNGEVGGILLLGPTGTGKTLFAKNLARELVTRDGTKGCDCITIDGSQDLDRLYIEGFHDLIDATTQFVYGPVVVAVYLANLRGICVLLINEINAIREGEQISLNSIIAEKEINLVSKAFEKHKLNDDAKLIVIGTMNPGYGGTFNMQEAFENRFLHKIECDYPKDEGTEIKIVQSSAKCDSQVAKHIVSALRQVRKQAQKDFSITKAVSTRLMVEFAKSVSMMPVEFINQNIRYAVINSLATNQEQRKSIAGILDGKKLSEKLKTRLNEIAREELIKEAKERGEDIEIDKATKDAIVKEAKERFNIYVGIYTHTNLINKTKGEIMLKPLKWFALTYPDVATKYFELSNTLIDIYEKETSKDHLYRGSITLKFCQYMFRHKQKELIAYMTEKYPVFSIKE